MKNNQLLIILLILFLTGCVAPSKTKTPNDSITNTADSLGYKTITFQGIELQYRDLSVNRHSQAVPSSFDTQPANEQNSSSNLVINKEQHQGVKLTFKKNRSSSLLNKAQLDSLKRLADYKELTVQYQIQASAGGDSSEARTLANKRATFLKSVLVKQGVSTGKILYLDYDPDMQGQLGFVWIKPLSVKEQLIYSAESNKKNKSKSIKIKQSPSKVRQSDA